MQMKISISHIKEKIPVTSGVNIPLKNPVYAYANLKYKFASRKLGEILKMIIKQEKKR